MVCDPRARRGDECALGRAAVRGVDDDAGGQSSHAHRHRGGDAHLRWPASLLPLQGHYRRQTVGEEDRVYPANPKARIPAVAGKFYTGGAVTVSTVAAAGHIC